MAEAPAFAGRRILITGAGTGIGAVTARHLAAHGARVAVLDRDGGAARTTAEALNGNGLAFTGDVTDPAACDGVFAAMESAWGGVDGLVNNAGTWDHGALLDLTPERWQRVFDVNLMAPIAFANAAVRRMGEGGAIVNVSSVMGQVAAPGRGPYCVSKAALIALTRLQAVEWAGRGIRVNAIAPGYIGNETTQGLADAGSFDLAVIERRTPMGRLGSEDEVARGIAWLLDAAQSGYVTGHVLEVNGGWTAYGYV